MNIIPPGTRTFFAKPYVWLMGLVLMTFLSPPPALAALGGDVTSVQADQEQMRAKRAVQPAGKYSVHEMTTDYGTAVREYVSPDGKVFGVAWRGRTAPDLRQLLGDFYDQFNQAALAQKKLRHRGPLVINGPGLVVVVGGHMRSYQGKAYVSGLLPEGVQAGEIR